jgi:hypothetical protein
MQNTLLLTTSSTKGFLVLGTFSALPLAAKIVLGSLFAVTFLALLWVLYIILDLILN